MSNKKQKMDIVSGDSSSSSTTTTTTTTATTTTITSNSSSSSSSVERDYGLNLSTLEGFSMQRILNISPESINLLGTFAKNAVAAAAEAGTIDQKEQKKEELKEEVGIVLLRRKKLTDDDVPVVCSNQNSLTLSNQNTYYGYYKSLLASVPQSFDVTVIHPAQQWHIDKYSKQENILFVETPDLYKKITEPYIETHSASEVKWLQQILQKKKEQDRILFEDQDPQLGFMCVAFEPAEKIITQTKIMPDNFMALVLVNRSNLPTIRSLTTSHLPLLRNIRGKVYEYVRNTLHLDPHHLRLFFHYKPTYFHLHVHVVHINHDMHTNTKDYLLDDVIQNIELSAHYYQQQTLVYKLGTNDALYKRYKECVSSSI